MKEIEGPAMPSIEVMESDLSAQRESISSYAATVVTSVQNDAEYEVAMVEIIRVRERRKTAEKFFKDLLDPLVATVNAMKAKIADALEPIRMKETALNSCIVAYAEKREAEAEAAKRQAELEIAAAHAAAMEADEPMLVDTAPAPISIPSQPASVKTGTHVGGVVNIPKWRFKDHPEINSDEDSDIYLDDPRAIGIDRRLFKLDRGRVGAWNRSKTPMDGIEHYLGKTTSVARRRA